MLLAKSNQCQKRTTRNIDNWHNRKRNNNRIREKSISFLCDSAAAAAAATAATTTTGYAAAAAATAQRFSFSFSFSLILIFVCVLINLGNCELIRNDIHKYDVEDGYSKSKSDSLYVEAIEALLQHKQQHHQANIKQEEHEHQP